MSLVGHIKQLEKLDELAASVAILDEGVDLERFHPDQR
jgi:hypothetical protein